MISPALLAAAADKGAGALTPEQLIQNQNMPAYLQQQNNEANANLPQQQANAYQADTAGKQIQNQEAQAILPLYLQAVAAKQAQGQNQPPQNASPQGDQPSAYDNLKQLNYAQQQEDLSNKQYGALNPMFLSNKANNALQQAILQTTKNAQDTFTSGINPKTGNTWEQDVAKIPPGKTNVASNLFNDYKEALPEITQLPKEQQAQIEKSFVAPAQPNMAVLSEQNINPSIVNNAAQRILKGQSTIAEETTKGRLYGPQALEFHDALLTAVQSQDPSFSEADNEGERAFANSPQTKKAISQLDNAYSTVAHLRDVYSKLNNTQYPTVNAAINGGKLQAGDVDQAAAAINQALGNDELTQAFARGGQPTDKLRGLSGILADKNLSPQQQGAQFNEILAGLQRSRQAYAEGGGKFVKPLNLPSTSQAQTITTKSGKSYQVQVQP